MHTIEPRNSDSRQLLKKNENDIYTYNNCIKLLSVALFTDYTGMNY